MDPVLNIRSETVKPLVPNIIRQVADGRGGRPAPSRLPEILFITSYPPRECGIATYSQDLIKALDNKFSNTFSLKVCALETGNENHVYPEEVKYTLNTEDATGYVDLTQRINMDPDVRFVFVQHEFGFFRRTGKDNFLQLLQGLSQPVIVVFHTVLPKPDAALKQEVIHIAAACASVVVMTKHAAKVLIKDYGVPQQKIVVIAHGTHLVPHSDKKILKEKYGLAGRKVLSTFGLLSSGKGIDTTLESLPAIIKINPDALFLVIGKTHPGVIKSEGEKYRNMLEEKVDLLHLQDHVQFINRYLPLEDLLEYLQLTDIYLFTSNDRNQAVSGTFSYAMSCGCPIISTPIPHARELLHEDTGIIFDFQNTQQLTDGVNRLLGDDEMRTAFRSSTLQQIVPTAWENSAIAHAHLLQEIAGWNQNSGTTLKRIKSPQNQATGLSDHISLKYRLPEISLEHLKKMTTDFGIIQFSKINQPDLLSGYTLDDNARALIATCMHFELTGDAADIKSIRTYLDFIKYCLQPEGYFLNYVDVEKKFTIQNESTNLADAHGRALWALGYLISRSDILPEPLITTAEAIMTRTAPRTEMMHSTRAMAFAIKGLYYSNLGRKSSKNSGLIQTLANRMVQMYRHESEHNWQWFESYLTYANSILPEAMLCAWLDTGNSFYKENAKASFDFLLSLTFNSSGIKVISNKTWMQKGQEAARHGEQPIDVAYTILALSKFYDEFKETGYLQKMATAFDWFLGNNHLHQIIYNPCTGGCYDGLEENHVNLNQGAESTLSYLMARLTIEQYTPQIAKLKNG